ncbi:hypothetical protein ACFOOM_30695 [Streptomyces echinoruber]|uniref:Uncharacterized protein n=1 Tax=Streptomyces echinoruber TaxID=68898 RepID=A0A918V7V0_9ACTN|nr:hypothetical protein [Streptomyces echinoruber]GGZ77504.1 hypothetical protein GCM10010389_14080 [Streptomyces echinoruber]
MGTKTGDEAGATAETGATEAAGAAGERHDEEAADRTGTDAGAQAAEADAAVAEDDAGARQEPAGPSGVGQGAGAVVSAVLGLVSLTGGWIGTVAGAREQLIGQLQTSTSATVAQQIKEVYGDAWRTTALWAGLFALAALVTGVVVLARPAFGAPGRPQAAWIKSVAWAGVTLGVVGLLLAVLKYTGVLLGLPSAS